MSKYKMIAIAYNEDSDSKGMVALDKVLDRSNGFLQKSDKVFLSRVAKILQDVKMYAENSSVDEKIVVFFKLNYTTQNATRYDSLLGEIYNIIKATNVTVCVLLGFQQHQNEFDIKALQCPYDMDQGPEMFFDLIIAEERSPCERVHLLKNRFGGLYTI